MIKGDCLLRTNPGGYFVDGIDMRKFFAVGDTVKAVPVSITTRTKSTEAEPREDATFFEKKARYVKVIYVNKNYVTVTFTGRRNLFGNAGTWNESFTYDDLFHGLIKNSSRR